MRCQPHFSEDKGPGTEAQKAEVTYPRAHSELRFHFTYEFVLLMVQQKQK